MGLRFRQVLATFLVPPLNKLSGVTGFSRGSRRLSRRAISSVRFTGFLINPTSECRAALQLSRAPPITVIETDTAALYFQHVWVIFSRPARFPKSTSKPVLGRLNAFAHPLRRVLVWLPGCRIIHQ